jgi:predicted TPR repeat methyltransferase
MTTAWLEQGLAHYAEGRWDEAGAALARALMEQPGNADAWYRLGNVREEQKRDTEAVECFRRAATLDPRHGKARNNLGGAYQRQGRHADAFAAYSQALESDPSLMEPYLNLGRLSESRGELDKAAGYLRAGLAQHPGHPMLVHLLTALSGQPTPRAPRDHIVAYFDGFAPEFDAQLARLAYRVPEAMANLVSTMLLSGERVLDLGCGTGLMGAALAGSGVVLDGIDLSPGMLKRAGERGIYSKLALADANEALAKAPERSYRAVLATDVFIYIGELTSIFRGVARVLGPDGLFGFSIETLEAGSFQLRSGGRYAHSLAYLRSLGVEAGFRERVAQPLELRREGGLPVQGVLVLLERL